MLVLASAAAAPVARATTPPTEGDLAHRQRLATFASRMADYQTAQAAYRQKTSVPRRTLYRGAPIRPGTSDLECLTQAIYYEARGEPRDGQIAVAQVILNRARRPSRPRGICQVVFEGAPRPGCQFSFACEGARQAGPVRPAIWSQSQTLASAMLGGQYRGDPSATHFHADYVQPLWARHMRNLGQIGRHIFFGDPAAPAQYFAHSVLMDAPIDPGGKA